MGREEKEVRCLRKYTYISKKKAALNALRENCALKIITFRYFAFFVELLFFFLCIFCARLFQVRTCVPCVQVATPPVTYHQSFAIVLPLINGRFDKCFHSRGHHLRKFIRTKESVCIRKEFNSHRIGLGHQHGRHFIVLEHQYGRRDVM